MGYIILGLLVLVILGFIWMMKRVKKIAAKRHQRFMDFAKDRGLKHSMVKIGAVGGFNTVEGQINGSRFLLQERMDGRGHKTRYHKTEAIIENTGLDFNFIIGGKYVNGIPEELEALNEYDLGINGSSLVAKTSDPEKLGTLIEALSSESISALQADFESGIIAHQGKLSYSLSILIPNEKRFQSYSTIVDVMIEISKANQ